MMLEKIKIETEENKIKSSNGAGDGIRTRDLLLGKETCCHCTTPACRQLLFYAIKSNLVKWTSVNYPASFQSFRFKARERINPIKARMRQMIKANP